MSVTTPAARSRVRLTSTISRHDPRCSIENTHALPTAPAPITPTFTASPRSFAQGLVSICLCWPASFSFSFDGWFIGDERSVSQRRWSVHTPTDQRGRPDYPRVWVGVSGHHAISAQLRAYLGVALPAHREPGVISLADPSVREPGPMRASSHHTATEQVGMTATRLATNGLGRLGLHLAPLPAAKWDLSDEDVIGLEGSER